MSETSMEKPEPLTADDVRQIVREELANVGRAVADAFAASGGIVGPLFGEPATIPMRSRLYVDEIVTKSNPSEPQQTT